MRIVWGEAVVRGEQLIGDRPPSRITLRDGRTREQRPEVCDEGEEELVPVLDLRHRIAERDRPPLPDEEPGSLHTRPETVDLLPHPPEPSLHMEVPELPLNLAEDVGVTELDRHPREDDMGGSPAGATIIADEVSDHDPELLRSPEHREPRRFILVVPEADDRQVVGRPVHERAAHPIVRDLPLHDPTVRERDEVLARECLAVREEGAVGVRGMEPFGDRVVRRELCGDAVRGAVQAILVPPVRPDELAVRDAIEVVLRDGTRADGWSRCDGEVPMAAEALSFLAITAEALAAGAVIAIAEGADQLFWGVRIRSTSDNDNFLYVITKFCHYLTFSETVPTSSHFPALSHEERGREKCRAGLQDQGDR